jgi:hypothetical protein
MNLTTAAVFVVECGLVFLGLGIVAVGVPSDNRTMLLIGYVPLTAAGIYHLWTAFSRRRSFFSVCDIHAATLFVSYFGGAAVTLGLSQGGVLRFWSAPQSALLLEASLYVVLFCAVLILLGRIEVRLWRGVWDIASQPGGWPSGIALFLAALGILQALLILRGTISYQGLGTIDGTRLPYGGAFVVALSWPLAGICGWVFGRQELRRRPLLAVTCAALVPVELVFNFTYGRRMVLFQSLIFVLCLVWARRKAPSVGRLAVAGIALLPLVYGLWVMFIGMRLENNLNYLPQAQRRDIFEHIDSTMNLMRSNWSEVMRYQDAEVTNRVFVIGYVTDLIAGARPWNAFAGRMLAWETLNAIPRFLWPAKFSLMRDLHAGQSGIAQAYGLPDEDRADSVLTSAFVDFHWLGILYAPIVFAVGVFCVGVIRLCRSRFVAVYVICYALLQAITPEQSFITESLNMIRLLIVLTPIFFGYILVLRVGRESPIRTPGGFARR